MWKHCGFRTPDILILVICYFAAQTGMRRHPQRPILHSDIIIILSAMKSAMPFVDSTSEMPQLTIFPSVVRPLYDSLKIKYQRS